VGGGFLTGPVQRPIGQRAEADTGINLPRKPLSAGQQGCILQLDDGVATEVELEVGKDYLSRRGEQVRITEIEPQGLRPVHFVVLTGRYKGVGAKDGSRLARNGRWLLQEDGTSKDHWNDLVAEFESPQENTKSPRKSVG
jgi:hypothetical protein